MLESGDAGGGADGSSNYQSLSGSGRGRMRSGGGGGRMVCSPYFVGATFILLLVVSVKYWSLSGRNNQLTDQLEELQLQLRSEGFNVKNLQSNIKVKDGQVDNCEKQRGELGREVEEKRAKIREMEAEMGEAQRASVQCNNHLTDARDKLEACNSDKQTITDRDNEAQRRLELKYDQIVELERKLQASEAEVTELRRREEEARGEIATLKRREEEMAAREPRPHVQGFMRNAKAGPIPPGELPDVKVGSVHVREKATQGMLPGPIGPDGHYLPLLPRGDPNGPRPPPRFSVMNPPKEDVFQKRGVKQESVKHEVRVDHEEDAAHEVKEDLAPVAEHRQDYADRYSEAIKARNDEMKGDAVDDAVDDNREDDHAREREEEQLVDRNAEEDEEGAAQHRDLDAGRLDEGRNEDGQREEAVAGQIPAAEEEDVNQGDDDEDDGGDAGDREVGDDLVVDRPGVGGEEGEDGERAQRDDEEDFDDAAEGPDEEDRRDTEP